MTITYYKNIKKILKEGKQLFCTQLINISNFNKYMFTPTPGSGFSMGAGQGAGQGESQNIGLPPPPP